MKLTVSIDSDNDTCQTRDDAIFLLKKVIRGIESGSDKSSIIDLNGNWVGKYKLLVDEYDDEEYEDDECPVDDEMCDRARDARAEDEQR